MQKIFKLAIVALLLSLDAAQGAQAGLFGPTNKEECILKYMPKTHSQVATFQVQRACDVLFNKDKTGRYEKKYAKCILDLDELFEANDNTAASIILTNSPCEEFRKVVYEFESPEGDVHEVTVPEGTTVKQAFNILQARLASQPSAKKTKPKSYLEKIAFNMNKKLPMKLDSETTALSVEAHHGSRDELIFWYKLSNIHRDDISASSLVKLKSIIKAKAVNDSCPDKNSATLLKKGVLIEYKYQDNTGVLISDLNFSLEKSDCHY